MLIRKLVVIFIYLTALLFGTNVDPFVVQNNRYIYKNSIILSPLSKEQILSANANSKGKYHIHANRGLRLLLKANQKLYIKTERDSQIYIDYSTDSILYHRIELKRDNDGVYSFNNNQASIASVILYSSIDNNITLLSTFNPALLEKYRADMIPLPLQKEHIVSFNDLKTQLYYYLPKNHPITIDLNDISSMAIKVRAILKGDREISGNRVRVYLKINHKKESIEVLGKSSLDYIKAHKDISISNEYKYYFNLDRDKNHITLYSDSDILISIEHYHQNNFYSSSSLKLHWHLNSELNSINQPIWRNSVVDGGVKRMKRVLSQSNNLVDPIQKSNLQKSAEYSVFKATLYPNHIPTGSRYIYAYYPKYSLILNKRLYQKINKNYTSQVAKLPFTTFVPIPPKNIPIYTKNSKRILKFIYLQYLIGDIKLLLKEQLDSIYPMIEPDDRLVISNCPKDSIVNYCQNIKDILISNGVPKNRIIISNQIDNSQKGIVQISAEKIVSSSKKLQYDFVNSTDNQSYLELLVWSKETKKQKFIIQIDKRKKLLFIYNPNDKKFQNYRVSRDKEALDRLGLKKSVDIIKTINNKEGFSILQRVGIFHLKLPKGAKSIRVYKLNKKDKLYISIKEYRSSIYKDTPYNLANHYTNSYKRFIKTLYQPIPKEFNPWYETTHPLRVWLLSQLKMLLSQVDSSSYFENGIKEHIKRAKKFNDTILIREIAKSILLFTKKASLRRYALNLLMRYSLNDKEKLTWQSIYFIKSKNISSLKSLAKALYSNGKLELALNLLILADRSPSTKKEIAKLSLLTNRFALRDEILKLSYTPITEILKLKKEILNSYDYQYSVWQKPIFIKADGGRAKIYSKSINRVSLLSKASAVDKIVMDFNGSYSVHFDIRALDNHSDIEWIDIIHNGITYQYPLVKLNPSLSLIDKNSNKKLSINNPLVVNFGAGKHHIVIKSHSEQIALSYRAKKIAPLQAQALKEQIYKPNTLYRFEATLPYLSKLLKDLKSKNNITRLRAKMQGYILKDRPHNIKYNAYILPLLRYTKFISITPNIAPLGYQKFSTSIWQPLSDIERARSPLLGNLSEYSAIVHGFSTLKLHFKGKRDIKIDFYEITPKFFPKEDMSFAIKIDNNTTDIITLNSQNRFSKQLKYHFSSDKKHSLEISLISALSTQYLAIKLFDNNKKVRPKKMQKYFITSKKRAVSLDEYAPLLLKVIEKDSTRLHRYYKYYPQKRLYHIDIPPTKKRVSYIRLSKMVFDPTMKISSSTSSYIPTIAKVLNYDKSIYNIPKERDVNSSLNIQATPTISAEVGLKKVDLTSEDSKKNESKYTKELALTYREKMNKYTYRKHRLFIRTYSNPLIGVENRVYTRVPFIDTTLKAKANIYTQKANNKTFANLTLGASVDKKEPISANLEQEFSIGALGYILMGSNPKGDTIDPLVWSRYKSNHKYGLLGSYGLKYRPYDDMILRYRASIKSNEKLYSADNIAQNFIWENNLYPFDCIVKFSNRYYLSDDNRDSGYLKDTISADFRYEKFFGFNRLELKAGIKHEIEKSDSSFSLQGIWHWSGQKYRYNFAPDETLFKNIKNIKDSQSAK